MLRPMEVMRAGQTLVTRHSFRTVFVTLGEHATHTTSTAGS